MSGTGKLSTMLRPSLTRPGKSTYIRSIVLMVVMAQIGSLHVQPNLSHLTKIDLVISVPAEYASFPIHRQLFARVSVDDSIETNVSTFAAEMQETAFILRNIDKHSMYDNRTIAIV